MTHSACFATATRLLVSTKQVEVELHDALLKYDGLVEPTATNQGAWLTESAGALSDLHSTVLGSLALFSVREDPALSSRGNALSRDAVRASEARVVPTGAETSCLERGAFGQLQEAVIGKEHQRTLCPASRERRQAEGRRDQRRTRLRHLGLLLARKRQFSASRQVCAPSSSSAGRPPSSLVCWRWG